jgi:hypothetical protein
MGKRARLAALAASGAILLACASPCPPCRCLTVEAESPGDLTLPYTLEIGDGIRCDVVSASGKSERLSCYVEDPSLEPSLRR